MTVKALWHLSTNKTAWQNVEPLPTTASFCTIESLYSFISLGTERTIATGQVPPEIMESMKVPYMKGDFNFPVNYGYSLVGKVVTENHPFENRMVHVMHPHQTHCWVSPESLTLIPDGVPPLRATLISNLETAVNACWDAQINIGDKVAVIGFGNIGALVACLVNQIPGVDLQIIDLDEEQLAVAKKMGFQNISAALNEDDFDIAFHSSGSVSGLQTSINCLANEGRLIELSWYGAKEVALKLGARFHQRRLQLISSQVSQIPANHAARWNYKRRKATVLELLKNPIFDALLTNPLTLNTTIDFFDQLRTNEIDGSGFYIKYQV